MNIRIMDFNIYTGTNVMTKKFDWKLKCTALLKDKDKFTTTIKEF